MKRFFLLLVLLLSVACGGEPQTIVETVVSEVEIPVTVEVPVEVEVTRVVETVSEVPVEVEVTRLVIEEVEVTRIVEVEATAPDVDTSQIFSANYLGSAESNGVTVEFGRVICMHRDALVDDGLSFDGAEEFNGHNYVCEVIWRITNETDSIIQWPFQALNVRINNQQISLYDWLFSGSPFGFQPTDEIFPSSTIVGGLWFGVRDTNPDDITTVALLFEPAVDADFHEITDLFVISAELPLPHEFVPLPEDLKS